MQKKTRTKPQVAIQKKATTKRSYSKKVEEPKANAANNTVSAAYEWMLANPDKAMKLLAMNRAETKVPHQEMAGEVANAGRSSLSQPEAAHKEFGSNLLTINDRILYLEERLFGINMTLVQMHNKLAGSAQKYETKLDEHREGNLLTCLHIGIDNVGALLNHTQSIIKDISETL